MVLLMKCLLLFEKNNWRWGKQTCAKRSYQLESGDFSVLFFPVKLVFVEYGSAV